MSLPDIPDEAIAAVMHAVHEEDAQTVTDALTPAWPHLYAAALRDLADRTEADGASFAGLTYIREIADEATP
jgi:hypothetical protein